MGDWIAFVRKFIRSEKISSVVDLGCGDWQFSLYIYHDLESVEYFGYDCVASVINANRKEHPTYSFEELEFSEQVESIRDAEMYILKDVLQHWSSARISRFLSELLQMKKNLRYIVLCNCCEPTDWPEVDIE